MRPLLLAFLWISYVVWCVVLVGVSLIFLLTPGFAKLLFTGKYTKVTNSKVTGYNYACLLCAYRWKWLIGTPLPETHVQPDLIMKGAEKLREDEEERRRRMD